MDDARLLGTSDPGTALSNAPHVPVGSSPYIIYVAPLPHHSPRAAPLSASSRLVPPISLDCPPPAS